MHSNVKQNQKKGDLQSALFSRKIKKKKSRYRRNPEGCQWLVNLPEMDLALIHDDFQKEPKRFETDCGETTGELIKEDSEEKRVMRQYEKNWLNRENSRFSNCVGKKGESGRKDGSRKESSRKESRGENRVENSRNNNGGTELSVVEKSYTDKSCSNTEKPYTETPLSTNSRIGQPVTQPILTQPITQPMTQMKNLPQMKNLSLDSLELGGITDAVPLKKVTEASELRKFTESSQLKRFSEFFNDNSDGNINSDKNELIPNKREMKKQPLLTANASHLGKIKK
jgi:hypothetical protein